MKSKLNEDTKIASYANVLITLPELAFLLRKSRSAVHKAWRNWVKKWGLAPIRFGGSQKGRLLFNRSEVDEMIKRWTVSQGAEVIEKRKASDKSSTQKRKTKLK